MSKLAKAHPENSTSYDDWLARIGMAIEAAVPETRQSGTQLAVRLADLLFERLPESLVRPLVERIRNPPSLFQARAHLGTEPALNHEQLVERAIQAYSQVIEDPDALEFDPAYPIHWETRIEPRCRRIVDVFLGELRQEIPESRRSEYESALPADVYHRIFAGPTSRAA